MRTAIVAMVLAACGLAFAGEADMGEGELDTPTVVNRTTDRCRVKVLRIDAPARTLRVEFSRGTGLGDDYAEHARDNVTVRNLPDDEDGNQQPQEFDLLMARTDIADWCKAQAESPTNAQVLKKLCEVVLKQKGITK